MGVAGRDYCVIAADTRMSLNYNIMTRNKPKCAQITSNCVLASCGMQADIEAFQKLIKTRAAEYEHLHGHAMSTRAVAQLVSTNLYYRRFFPFYTFNLVAGLDELGRGVVYGYDAVGSFDSVGYGAQGSGSTLAFSLLDNQVSCETHPGKKDMSVEEAVQLLQDAFTSVGERDIYTGDSVDLFVISAAGTEVRRFALKRD
jgi:20S proteasome subunit beta 6